MAASGARILDGISVLELGSGALTGLAGMVLADFGARVTWLDPESRAGHPVWHRGKSRVPVDVKSQDERIADLVRTGAQVFLTDLPAARLAHLGLDYARLSTGRPDLVQCELSLFGDVAPWNTLAGDESLVAAKLGRMMVFEGVAERAGPVYSALQVGTHGASQAAVAGICAQLSQTARGARGRLIRGSIARSLMAYDMAHLYVAQMDENPFPAQDPHAVMPTLNYQPVQCADGQWIQLGNLLPHLFENFLRAAQLDDLLNDADFAAQPWSEQTTERYRQRILTHMQTRPRAEWMDRFLSDGGVVAHPFQTTQQALTDPDVTANGHAVRSAGRQQLGVLGLFAATPGEVADPVTSATLDALDLPRLELSDTAREAMLPLAGVTVVESATIIASPLGAGMLADLGARVIKLEPMDGDPFRNMAAGVMADRCNTGKESIALNLKREEGQRIAQQIIAGADIFIHNYRPGVPERLGLDHGTLSADHPRLVYLSVNGYGPAGPGAHRPSTHPVPGAALGGVLYQFGPLPEHLLDYATLRETCRRVFRANELNPDPNTSFVVASAACLGLLAARRYGIGQKIYLDMMGANAYANFDDFVSGPHSARTPLDDAHTGPADFQRLYPCARGWLYVRIEAEHLQRRFMELTGGFDGLRQRTAQEWEQLLVAEGLGCVQADGPLPGLRISDPEFQTFGLTAPCTHPARGAMQRHAAMVELPGAAMPMGGPCALGDHTREILDQLGYTDARVQELMLAGVVG